MLIGQISTRSVTVGLIAAPMIVAVGSIVLWLSDGNLVLALSGVALWGIGIAAAVVVYQQAILLIGARAPETATSIGVVLAQAGFAAGATVGGLSIEILGIRTIPVVALMFVVASIIIATTLGPAIHHAHGPNRLQPRTTVSARDAAEGRRTGRAGLPPTGTRSSVPCRLAVDELDPPTGRGPADEEQA